MIEQLIAAALDDADQIHHGAPLRWEQTQTIIDTLTRFGYSIQQERETL